MKANIKGRVNKKSIVCRICGKRKKKSTTNFQFGVGKKRESWNTACRPCLLLICGAAEKRRQERRRKNRDFVYELKAGKPCVDCGFIGHPCQMDFDHVRGKKSFSIASSAKDRCFSSIAKEASKCEVVCANCHRLRTRKAFDRKMKEEYRVIKRS